MSYRLFYMLTACSFFLLNVTQSMGQVNFTSSNLPIVVINTRGQTILDDPKITCDLGIIWNEDGQRNYTSDPFNEYDGVIGIEIRGPTSQQYPKKSYGFETRDTFGENLNVSLLGLPKENDWILYGVYTDKSLMRNAITYNLFSWMQPWSPGFVYCELQIDGEYMGIYALVEKIKRDKNRIDIAKLDENDNAGDSLTGGYIIKIDKPTGSSAEFWTSQYQSKVEFRYHDPKYDELSATQRNYIRNYVDDFEDVVYSSGFSDSLTGYRSMIDVESFIDLFLMQELGRTVVGYRSSSFMYKDKESKGGLLTCGPMWDFNLSYGNADYCDGFDTTGWQYNFTDICNYSIDPPDWWPRLLEDTVYANELHCRWENLRSTILSESAIEHLVDSIATYLDESQERNFTKWPILGEYVNWNYFVGETYQEEIDYLKWWFKSRSRFLDDELPGICSMVSTVQDKKLKEKSPVLFPNPTSGVVFISDPIDLNSSSIKVVGVDGREVAILTSRNSIDLGDVPYGFYIVMIDNHFYKVLKQ